MDVPVRFFRFRTGNGRVSGDGSTLWIGYKSFVVFRCSLLYRGISLVSGSVPYSLVVVITFVALHSCLLAAAYLEEAQ